MVRGSPCSREVVISAVLPSLTIERKLKRALFQELTSELPVAFTVLYKIPTIKFSGSSGSKV